MTEAQLQAEVQSAMRARDSQKTLVLRGLLAAVKNLKVEKQVKELPEADIVGLVRKEISKRAEAISYAEQAGRADLAEQNRAERALLEAYAPAQLSASDLESVIRGLSAELGTTQIGPLMAELRKRHAGTFDGKMASEIIKGLTGGS